MRWEDVKCRTPQQENDYEEPEQFNNFGQKNTNDFIQIPEDIDQDEQEHNQFDQQVHQSDEQEHNQFNQQIHQSDEQEQNQFNQQIHQSDEQEHNQFNQQKHQFIDEDEQNEDEHEQKSNEHQEDEEPQRDFDVLGAPSQVNI